ncbi:hypothetical protein EDB84DRAFT_1438872 [Lactarius hengduanensis]|nr:hypothetical protein EDB84DRAFT_1438872 [Lactarius hengduanensis]
MSSPQSTQRLSLADRISSPQTHSIPLADRITSISPPDSPTLTEPAGDLPILRPEDFPDFNAPSPGSEPITADLPGGIHLHGYERYNPYNATHHRYRVAIPIQPGVTKDPHYIAFRINTFTHRHITVGRREGATEPLGDYAEDLVAAPYWDPMPNTTSPTEVLRDPGVVADIDRYRVLWSEKEELQRRERELTDAWDQWRDTSGGVTKRLTMAKARSRLHPYLMGQAHVTTVRNNNDIAISSGIPISDVIHHRVPTPPYALPYPQLHDGERPSVTRWIRTMGQQSHVSEQPTPTPQRPASRIKCTKCKIPNVNHIIRDCPLWDACRYCEVQGHKSYNCAYPHTLCARHPKCYVPHSHTNHGGTGSCPWHKEVWAASSSREWTTGEWDANYDEDHYDFESLF